MTMAIDWFGDGINYPGLSELLEATAASLFPDDEITEAAQSASAGDQIALMQYEDMLAQVIDASYTREPNLFGNIIWVNSELGTPMWVRPGESWQPDSEATPVENVAKRKRTTIANRKAYVASSVATSSIDAFTKQQQKLLS